MPAPKGNKYWNLRSKHGRDKLFESPEMLWEAACQFFAWCEKNPLKEERVFVYKGRIVRAKVAKMRAMTLSGLCFYLRCNEAYFRTFKKQLKEKQEYNEIDEGFNTVISDIESVIYNTKFQGASADQLNANIISRELGLSDKHELSGLDGGPIETKNSLDVSGLSEDDQIALAEISRKIRNGKHKQPNGK